MIERPILFSDPMICPILDRRKTQTRRVIRTVEMERYTQDYGLTQAGEKAPQRVWLMRRKDHFWEGYSDEEFLAKCPYGKPGDRLWVRETWQLHEIASDVATIVYRASKNRSHSEFVKQVPVALIGNLSAKPFQSGWRPSIHMPRWASRLTLEIASVGVERLQDISEDDAQAEGCKRLELSPRILPDCQKLNGVPLEVHPLTSSYKEAFAKLWDGINGNRPNRAWADNPRVWKVAFNEVQPDAPDYEQCDRHDRKAG